MRNTVTERATLVTKIQEIKSMCRHEMYKNKVIVIVEGDDDKKIFEKFIDTEKALLYAAKSCIWVAKVVERLNERTEFNDRVIGIKDADFDHILRKDHRIPNLFVTDSHDIEMTLISNDFENGIYAECGIHNYSNILIKVAEEIKTVSFIRLYNQIKVDEDEELDGINFDGLVMNSIYDGINPVDLGLCLNHIKAKGNQDKSWFPEETDITNMIRSCTGINLKQLTRGHDLMYGLLVKIKALTGRDKMGYKDLCLAFRFHLRQDAFMKTQLYTDINSYISQKGIVLWKDIN